MSSGLLHGLAAAGAIVGGIVLVLFFFGSWR
jgi:hypothetical protein